MVDYQTNSQTACRTAGCSGDPNSGEGWDGYCGSCADRLDTEAMVRAQSAADVLFFTIPGDDVAAVDHYSRYAGERVVHTDWKGTRRTGTVRVNLTRCRPTNPNCVCSSDEHPGHVDYRPLVIDLDGGGTAYTGRSGSLELVRPAREVVDLPHRFVDAFRALAAAGLPEDGERITVSSDGTVMSLPNFSPGLVPYLVLTVAAGQPTLAYICCEDQSPPRCPGGEPHVVQRADAGTPVDLDDPARAAAAAFECWVSTL